MDWTQRQRATEVACRVQAAANTGGSPIERRKNLEKVSAATNAPCDQYRSLTPKRWPLIERSIGAKVALTLSAAVDARDRTLRACVPQQINL